MSGTSEIVANPSISASNPANVYVTAGATPVGQLTIQTTAGQFEITST